MKQFIDHANCLVSLLFNEYIFKLYINVNNMITDGVFYIHSQRDQHAVVEIKKLPNFTVITDPKFFESAEISGVSQVTANSSLRMTSFEFSNLLVVLTNIFMKKVYLQTGFVSA